MRPSPAASRNSARSLQASGPTMASLEAEKGGVSTSGSRSSVRSTKATANVVPNKKREEDMDELDLLVCHEEFHSLVALVEKVKHVQDLLRRANPSAMEYYHTNKPSVPKSCLAPDEVLAVVERMREKLSFSDVTIRRGSYPVTDATMDDNFVILQSELEFCESCLRNSYADSSTSHSTLLHRSMTAATPPRAMSTSTSTSTTPNKYSKWQSDILLDWLVRNHKDPTLSKPEAEELAQRTGLKPSQVSTWLQNMRRRRKKNTIEGTKKATHFLDFLFLAHERDKNGGNLPKDVEIDGLMDNMISTASHTEATTGAASHCETPNRKRAKSSSASYDSYPAKNFIPFTPPVYSALPVSTTSGPLFPPQEVTSHSRDQQQQRQDWQDTMDGTITSIDMLPMTRCKQESLRDACDDTLSLTQESLYDCLQTVTESFDDSSIEPASIDIEIDDDDDVLLIFATTWHDTPNHIATPPDQVQSNTTIAIDDTGNKASSSTIKMEDLRDPALDSIDLMEWDDVDVSPISIFRKRLVEMMVDGQVDEASMTIDTKQEAKE